METTDHRTKCPYCEADVIVESRCVRFNDEWRAYIRCPHCNLHTPEVTAENQLKAISDVLTLFDRITI